MMRPTLAVSLLLLAVVSVGQPAPAAPRWDPQFTVSFHQVLRIGPTQWENDVVYNYDSLSNVSRQDHSDGQHDEYCSAIRPGTTEACSHIVAPDGWRYILFPRSGYCCQCCNRTVGCGIISPTWLTGAKYVGQETVNGTRCDGWMQQGGEQNYYYATADSARVPCLYYEGYPVLEVGKNSWLYNRSSYRTQPRPDPSLFDVPQSCHQPCPGLCRKV